MQLILSNADYSFAASTKAITLASPFDVLTAEQILHIINLSTRSVIYDSDRRTHPITVTTGVITHTYDSVGMTDSDVLQISVDDGTNSAGSGVLNNFVATVAPTADDDSDDDYAVGSRWIDVTADKAYVCLDSTVGAAVWTETTVVNPEVFLVAGTPGSGVGEVGDIAVDTDTGDIYEKEDVFVGTTWNPSDCSTKLTISHDDLRATHDSTSWNAAVRSVLSIPSGKWYWEVRFKKIDSSISGGIGVAGTNQSLSSLLGASADAHAFVSNGSKRNNSTETAYGTVWNSTDYTLGVALDMDAGKIWFSLNGVWQASGDPAAGTNEAFSGISGTVYAAMSMYPRYNYATANFGSSAFTYTVPTGFTAGLGANTTPWVKKLAVPKTNLSASADPTTGDDSGDGYSVGSRWENTTDIREFVCLDATVAAAVWVETTHQINIAAKRPGYWFDGSNDYVDIGDNFAFVTTAGKYSVLADFNVEDATSGTLINISPGASTTDRNGIVIDSNELRMGYYDGAYTGKSGAVVENVENCAILINDSGALTGYLNSYNLTGTASPGLNADNTIGYNASSTLNGVIRRVFVFNLILSSSEVNSFSEGMPIPFKYIGASETALTSGSLVIGKQYAIDTFVAGDDFTNVGGTNVTGNEFIATGTTPTTWTNSSSLRHIGCVLQLEPDGIGHTQWLDNSGNELHGVVSGALATNLPADDVERFRHSVAMTDDTAWTDVVPVGED